MARYQIIALSRRPDTEFSLPKQPWQKLSSQRLQFLTKMTRNETCSNGAFHSQPCIKQRDRLNRLQLCCVGISSPTTACGVCCAIPWLGSRQLEPVFSPGEPCRRGGKLTERNMRPAELWSWFNLWRNTLQPCSVRRSSAVPTELRSVG